MLRLSGRVVYIQLKLELLLCFFLLLFVRLYHRIENSEKNNRNTKTSFEFGIKTIPQNLC